MLQICTMMKKVIPPEKWVTVRIETELRNQIEKLIDSPKYKKMAFTGVSAMLSYLARKEIDHYK